MFLDDPCPNIDHTDSRDDDESTRQHHARSASCTRPLPTDAESQLFSTAFLESAIPDESYTSRKPIGSSGGAATTSTSGRHSAVRTACSAITEQFVLSDKWSNTTRFSASP